MKEKTGQKGKALFHPIRVALTGEGGGPELDLAVPAIDRGAQLSQEVGLGEDPERPRAGQGVCAAIADGHHPESGRTRLMLIYGINPVLEALKAQARDARAR